MSKVRVARISTFLDFGGLEKRFENIARYSGDLIENVFISISHGGQAEKNIRELGKEVHCLNYAYKIPSIQTVFKLSTMLKELKIDVVHTSGAEANFHGILAAHFAGVKVRIAEEIGYPAHGGMAKSIFRYIYKMSDAVLVNSVGVKQRLVELKESSESKIKVVHNPCIFPERKKEYKQSETLTFITVSRLTEVKNLDFFISVFKDFLTQNPGNYFLKIVGDGEEREFLEALVESLELQDFVRFEGYSENPENHLLESEIFVLPSLTEGFPNALLEAMALGLNTVATKVGGASEMIEDGVTGWLIDPTNREDLYAKLVLASEAKLDEKKDMGSKARAHVKANFTLEQHMEKLYSIYSAD